MLLMLVTSMAFVSCSDDDDDEGYALAELIGSWQTFSSYTDGDVVIMQVGVLLTFNEDFTATERAIIRENNEVTMDRTLSFTYEYDGTLLKLKNDKTGVERTYRIMITNNKLAQIDDELSDITIYSKYTPDNSGK